MKKLQAILPILLLACSGTPKETNMPNEETTLNPPIAAKKQHEATIHGDTRSDPYHWMQQKDSPEVLSHLAAENAYAEAFMKPQEELQTSLYKEIVGRIEETDLSVPQREGDYFYYSRAEEGKQYRIYCRKKGTLDAEENVILDMNELAKGQPFMGLGTFKVSSDGRYLAYSIDNTGFRQYRLQVKDLSTGKNLSEDRDKVKSIAWSKNGKTLFYAIDDDAERPYQIYRHALGKNHDSDEMIYEEADERFQVTVWLSRNQEYLFLDSSSHTTSEIRYLPTDKPTQKFKLISKRKPDHEYAVTHHGDHFYIRTNDKGRNFRIVKAKVTAPETWEEVIPHSKSVMLEELDVFQDFFVLAEREGGLPYLRMGSFANTKDSERLSMPEPAYSLSTGRNPEFSTNVYRYHYASLTTPGSVFEFDTTMKSSKLLKQTAVLGDYDPKEYKTERIFVTAKDGTKIPVSLVRKRSAIPNAPSPTLLVGYGSYGYPYPISFSHARVSLLSRGVTVAIAHIRGGGEMGKEWHDEGRMMNKKNTFSDFIAVADHLVESGISEKSTLVARGGSAGGLLMGAIANMRPDLFGGLISQVPFVDVLNTMLDEDLPLTVGEYEEWGNPNEREAYEYIKSYCPYTNLEKKAYPITLVKTSYNDSQVMYWEPAKYVARLRDFKTDNNPVLFHINMDGGHGGSSGRYDRIKETAYDYSFMFHVWDMTK